VTQRQIKSQSRMVPRLERMKWIAVVRTMEPPATEPAATLHDEEGGTARLACTPRGASRDRAGQRTDSTSHRSAELNARFPDILCVTGLS
jgi:hypothetical protein